MLRYTRPKLGLLLNSTAKSPRIHSEGHSLQALLLAMGETYLLLRLDPLVDGNGRGSRAILEGEDGVLDERDGRHGDGSNVELCDQESGSAAVIPVDFVPGSRSGLSRLPDWSTLFKRECRRPKQPTKTRAGAAGLP